MFHGVEFFTATCLSWQPLLAPDDRKKILIESLKFMVDRGQIWVYGFVIMPNHIHLMWRRQDAWLTRNAEQNFLKFTAQQIKFRIQQNCPEELSYYRSTQSDRLY